MKWFMYLIKEYLAQVNTKERLNVIIDFLSFLIYLISLNIIWNNVGREGSTLKS